MSLSSNGVVQVRQGYVHVWGDASPRAYIDSAAKPPMLVPELDPDAESAVMRDGSQPLHVGKRYLRGAACPPADSFSLQFMLANSSDLHMGFLRPETLENSACKKTVCEWYCCALCL